MQDQDKLLRVQEVASRLALKPSTIRKMIAERRIDSVRPSPRAVRVPARVVEEILRQGFRPAIKNEGKDETRTNLFQEGGIYGK